MFKPTENEDSEKWIWKKKRTIAPPTQDRSGPIFASKWRSSCSSSSPSSVPSSPRQGGWRSGGGWAGGGGGRGGGGGGGGWRSDRRTRGGGPIIDWLLQVILANQGQKFQKPTRTLLKEINRRFVNNLLLFYWPLLSPCFIIEISTSSALFILKSPFNFLHLSNL